MSFAFSPSFLVRRTLVVLLLTGLALVLLLSTGPSPRVTPAAGQPAAVQRAGSYTPQTGAIFNRPVGSRAQQRAIFTHVNRAIDAATSGSTIRIAVYSFAEEATADRLLAAYRRGVSVKLIFNPHTIYPAERRLAKVLGSRVNARSFVKFCDHSCRGTSGVMHQKVFLFTRAGAAENVVMVGSNNMTRHNAVDQWSDIYTVVGDAALFFTYAGVFDQMKTDTPQTTPYIQAEVNSYEPEFYPRRRTTMVDDPIYLALSAITCQGAAEGYGTAVTAADGTVSRVTRVRISQHAWNGDRGRYLVAKVAELARSGCDVKVVYGVGAGTVVKQTLARTSVPASSGRVRGVHTHQKMFSVSGVFEGDPASALVWTGSHNWSDGALRRDDVVLRVDSPEAYAQYDANFEDMWRNG